MEHDTPERMLGRLMQVSQLLAKVAVNKVNERQSDPAKIESRHIPDAPGNEDSVQTEPKRHEKHNF